MMDPAPSMPTAAMMDCNRSMLLIVDVQERLAPAIPKAEAVIDQTRKLIQAARRLEVPVMASEHYVKGLGPTVVGLSEHLNDRERLEKRHFDATKDKAIHQHLQSLGRDQAVIVGTEAHVCVLQTALGCLNMGIMPFVAADAVASRQQASREHALNRLMQAGARVVTSEMVMFEWIEEAGTDTFRDLLPLLR